MESFQGYCLRLCVMFALSLLPIFVLNVLLARQSGVLEAVNILASEWQQRTHGITDGTSNQLWFKALRLNDRLHDINGAVFGSSTSMGITQDLFRPGISVYNFSSSGRMLPSIVGDIAYILEHSNQVKLLFVPFEWSLGFGELADEPQTADLSTKHVVADIRAADRRFPWGLVAADALSYPSVKNLFRLLYGLVTRDDPISNAIATFTPYGLPEYTCDGVLVKNFNIKLYRQCEGFAYDGSNTYMTKSDGKRLNAEVSKAVINQALTPGLCAYCRALESTDATPNALSLTRLAEQIKEQRRRGGQAIFFMPPLFPGFEIAYLAREDLSPELKRTKETLAAWAKREGVLLVDAGQSERFGCRPEEFADLHHARNECYKRIFDWIWMQPGTGISASGQ
jgi:hypothetical protein